MIRCSRSSPLLLTSVMLALALAFFSITNAANVVATAASPTPLAFSSKHHHHNLRSSKTIVTQQQPLMVVQLHLAAAAAAETSTIPEDKGDSTKDKSTPSSTVMEEEEDGIVVKQVTPSRIRFLVQHDHHRRRMRGSQVNLDRKILHIPIKYWLVILLTILITLCCSCNWFAIFCYFCRFRRTADDSDDSSSIPMSNDVTPSSSKSKSSTREQVILPRAPSTPSSSSSLARRSRLSPIDELRATPARGGSNMKQAPTAWVSPLASRLPDEAEI